MLYNIYLIWTNFFIFATKIKKQGITYGKSNKNTATVLCVADKLKLAGRLFETGQTTDLTWNIKKGV